MMPHDPELKFRRIRFAAVLKPWQDTGPLVLRSRDGRVHLTRDRIALLAGDAVRIDMPYPAAPPEGLTADRWTARWPLARSRGAVLADVMLAAFPTVALLLPFLLLAAPGGLVRAGLAAGATCLFSASCLARQRLERDETIRIHARFWDRIIQTPFPPADADDLSDYSLRRAFLLERGLEGPLTRASERRDFIAPIAVVVAAAILLPPDPTLRLLFTADIIAALGMAFLMESARLALGGRFAVRRHEASRLERLVALATPALRQLGAAAQRHGDLAARHLEMAKSRRTFRLMQASAAATPFWLAAAGFVTALAAQSSLNADAVSGLLLLGPAIWCAADAGRRLARLGDAWRRIAALKPLALDQPSPTAREAPPGRFESVRLEEVDFRHDPAAKPVFTAFSMAIARGDVIALTGPSGSGKSTLLDILMGLKVPQTGRIVVNGKLRDWQALSGYRARVAGIFQDMPLGLATIRSIIGQNAPMAREADILQAASDAGLAKAIAALPMGVQSLVAEGGFPQSLGQQLLIARALAQQPDLLVLDETFSALDRPVVETVIAAVRRRGIALVFATHRADLAALADRTIALDPHLMPFPLPDLQQAEFAP